LETADTDRDVVGRDPGAAKADLKNNATSAIRALYLDKLELSRVE
jgi:hypothetical protein